MKSFLTLLMILVLSEYPTTSSADTMFRNRTLIDAMPPSVQSIGIVRLSEIGDGSLLAREFVHLTDCPGSREESGLREFLRDQLFCPHLKLWAFGGSNFVAPVGIGSADGDFVEVFELENGTTELESRISGRESVSLDTHAGVHVYEERIVSQAGDLGVERELSYYVAFVGGFIVVTAQKLEEIHYVLARLQQGNEVLSDRWTDVLAEPVVDSPVLILRNLVAPGIESGGKPYLAPQPFLLSMWIADHSRSAFQFFATSSLSTADAREYFEKVAIAHLMGKDDYALTFVREENGFRGEFLVKHHQNGAYHLDLIYLWLLGLWIHI